MAPFPATPRPDFRELVIEELLEMLYGYGVEKERIPTGEDPDYHLKLGPGSISDIEFLTQLLQLRHGGQASRLRVPGTLAALEMTFFGALVNAGSGAFTYHQIADRLSYVVGLIVGDDQ